MNPTHRWLVAALALAAFLALPAAVHAAKDSCDLDIDKRYKNDFLAFCKQWRAGKPKLPKALKHDTVLFVHPDGRYVWSSISTEGYGMAVLFNVSYTDEGNNSVFSLGFEEEEIENADTERIFPETAFRYFLLSKKYRPVSGKNTGPLSRVRFPIRNLQLNLTFRFKGRSHSFKLSDLHTPYAGTEQPVCEPGEILRAKSWKTWVLIQFNGSEIIGHPGDGSVWCQREVRILKVVLGKGAPVIRYNPFGR